MPDKVEEFGKGLILSEIATSRTWSWSGPICLRLSKAGHCEHVLRDNKKTMHLRSCQICEDGRYHSKGEIKHDTYEVHVAEADSEYDFIFLSVRHVTCQRSCGNLW